MRASPIYWSTTQSPSLAILSVSSPGVHFGDDGAAADLARHVNEFAASVVTEHRDRFGFFASVPLPCVEAAVDETVHALDRLGARGVILLSNSASQSSWSAVGGLRGELSNPDTADRMRRLASSGLN